MQSGQHRTRTAAGFRERTDSRRRCNHERRKWSLAVVFGSLALSCSDANFEPDEGVSLRHVAQPLCGLPDSGELLPGAVETPEGHWDYQSWLASDRVQSQLPALQALLQRHPEHVLGVAPDHLAQEVVVVVDDSSEAVELVQAELHASGLDLPMRTQPACHRIGDLYAVRSDFESRPWLESTPPFAAHLDVALGRYVVTLNAAATDAVLAEDPSTQSGKDLGRSAMALSETDSVRSLAADLEAEFGSLVQVKLGQAGTRSRLSDGQPHFGAAGIGSNNANFCTAGFVVERNGTLGAVTAGHCYPSNGTAITSGTRAYGVSAGLAAVPAFDMTRIDPAGQQFTNTIHTDPGAPISRRQIGKADPVFLDLVCVSGMVTGARCGIEVLDNFCTIFNPGMGITTGLTRGVRVGVTIGQQGDSGAPVYKRSGDTGAIIIGMETGGAVDDEICFHPVSTIEAQLGVQVAL